MSMRNDREQRGESAGQHGPERQHAQDGSPAEEQAASDLTQREDAEGPAADGSAAGRGRTAEPEDPAGPQDQAGADSSPAGADGDETPPSGSRRARREAQGDVASKRVNALPFLLAGALVVLFAGGLIWWFVIREAPPEQTVAEERDDNPGIDGVIQRGAEPDQWLAGDCLSGFESEHEPATIVECDRSYDRQVLAWGDLEEGSYPGDDQVSEQAIRVCEEDGELDQDQLDAVDYEIEVELSHPSEDTWTSQDSDRRVNCLLRRVDGQQLSGNFVLEPEEDSSAEDFEESEEADSGNEGEETEGAEGVEDEGDAQDADGGDDADADADEDVDDEDGEPADE